MIERIIENWLDKANERSFQIPFCYALINEGYTIIHSTKHNIMEMGKDIIAIDPDGKTPCAFQLKNVNGSKLNLTMYRSDLENQLNSLVYNKIVHPSIEYDGQHKSFIVINGELDEAVQISIDQFNRAVKDKGLMPIKIVTKGQLLKKFIDLQDKLWPSELKSLKEFLEIYVEDGNGILPKEKFANLLLNSLPFHQEKVKDKECIRSIASASVICSSAINSFTICNNHFAEFEAWVIYLSYTLALAEQNNIKIKKIKVEIEIALSAIFNSLQRLCDEIMENENLDDKGNPAITDVPLYNIKITLLSGLMGIYALWMKRNQVEINECSSFLNDFCLKNLKKLKFWGEYAMPQLLSYYFYFREIDATPNSDFMLYSLITGITYMNKPRSPGLLPNPYYDVDEVMPYILGIEKSSLNDSFRTSSYSLESVMHLFVRTNWKQHMKNIWPKVTKIDFESFKPENPWEYYFWNCDGGTNFVKIISPLQKWDDLKKESEENCGKEIPTLMKEFPIFYLCFLIVFPHRLNSSGIRWIDSELKNC